MRAASWGLAHLERDAVDDAEDLAGLGFEVEGLDGVDEFVDRDVSTSVVIKDVEDFFEFGDSLSREIFLGVLGRIEGGFACSWL